MTYIPQDDQTRKSAPLFRALLGYFPAALFEVAAHSLDSDRKHNPDSTTGPNWSRGKSMDHEDCVVRHLIDAGPRRGLAVLPLWLLEKLPGSSAKDAKRYHLRSLAWRALALLQEDCEATGSAPGVSCVFPATLNEDVRAACNATPAPEPNERWGVFYCNDDGSSRRSVEFPDEYTSKACADQAINFANARGDDLKRFSARLGWGAEVWKVWS
jgi:hypothetical protein